MSFERAHTYPSIATWGSQKERERKKRLLTTRPRPSTRSHPPLSTMLSCCQFISINTRHFGERKANPPPSPIHPGRRSNEMINNVICFAREGHSAGKTKSDPETKPKRGVFWGLQNSRRPNSSQLACFLLPTVCSLCEESMSISVLASYAPACLWAFTSGNKLKPRSLPINPTLPRIMCSACSITRSCGSNKTR